MDDLGNTRPFLYSPIESRIHTWWRRTNLHTSQRISQDGHERFLVNTQIRLYAVNKRGYI